MLFKRLKNIVISFFLFLSLYGCGELMPTMPSVLTQTKPNKVASRVVSECNTAGEQIFKATSQPHFVALLLPLTGKLSVSGQAIRDGFLAAHFYAQQKNQAVGKIKFFNTDHRDVKKLYLQAVSQGADFIVGPLTKSEVAKMTTQRPLTVPVLALNTITDYQKNSLANLFQFGLSPQDEAIQAAYKIWQDGYRRVLTIAPNDSWGKNLVRTFTYNFAHLGGQTVDGLAYRDKSELSQQIGQLLEVDAELLRPKEANSTASVKIDPLFYRRQDFDAFFLIANPEDARLIRPLLKFHFAGNIPVYATSLVYDGNPNPRLDSDLNGITFCDLPWVLRRSANLPPYVQKIKQQIASIWRTSPMQLGKFYALGIDAYNSMRFLNTGSIFPNNGLAGATGILYLDRYRHIYRNLDWAKFKNGKPTVIR